MKMEIAIFLFLLFLGLVLYIYRPESYNNDAIQEIKTRLGTIDESFSNVPIIESNKSFTRNKRTIYMCIRDPSTGDSYDINTLMYVALHELAHVITQKFDDQHGAEFQENFRTLQKLGAERGVYNPNKPIPPTYCNL